MSEIRAEKVRNQESIRSQESGIRSRKSDIRGQTSALSDLGRDILTKRSYAAATHHYRATNDKYRWGFIG